MEELPTTESGENMPHDPTLQPLHSMAEQAGTPEMVPVPGNIPSEQIATEGLAHHTPFVETSSMGNDGEHASGELHAAIENSVDAKAAGTGPELGAPHPQTIGEYAQTLRDQGVNPLIADVLAQRFSPFSVTRFDNSARQMLWSAARHAGGAVPDRVQAIQDERLLGTQQAAIVGALRAAGVPEDRWVGLVDSSALERLRQTETSSSPSQQETASTEPPHSYVRVYGDPNTGRAEAVARSAERAEDIVSLTESGLPREIAEIAAHQLGPHASTRYRRNTLARLQRNGIRIDPLLINRLGDPQAALVGVLQHYGIPQESWHRYGITADTTERLQGMD